MANRTELDKRVIWVGLDNDYRCVAKTFYAHEFDKEGIVRFIFEKKEGEDALGQSKWKKIEPGFFGKEMLSEMDYVQIQGDIEPHVGAKLWYVIQDLCADVEKYFETADKLIEEYKGS